MIKRAAEVINPIVMEVETDPVVCAEVARRREMHNRNWDWLEAHSKEVYSNRGKYICISNQELFVGDDIAEVLHRARTAHPDDDGRLTRYIPLHRAPRIYAH